MSDTTCGQLHQRPITTASLYLIYTLSPSFSGVVRILVRDEPAAVVLRGARNSLLSHSDYYQHSELSGDILSQIPARNAEIVELSVQRRRSATSPSSSPSTRPASSGGGSPTSSRQSSPSSGQCSASSASQTSSWQVGIRAVNEQVSH